MKTREEILSRLRKLRTRYATRYMESTRTRLPCNCRHNHVHHSTNYSRSLTEAKPTDIAPRSQVTLLVLQEDRPIGLCMYGSEDSSKWSGNICDSKSTAESCPYFTPKTTVPAAREEFLTKLADDEFVFDNYRDIAALQWVLGERIHNHKLSLWERILFWFRSRSMHVLPPSGTPALLESDLTWNEDDNSPSA